MDLGVFLASSSEKSLLFARALHKSSLKKYSWKSAARTLNLELVVCIILYNWLIWRGF